MARGSILCNPAPQDSGASYRSSPQNRALSSRLGQVPHLSPQLIDLVAETSGILEAKLLGSFMHLLFEALDEPGEGLPTQVQNRTLLNLTATPRRSRGIL